MPESIDIAAIKKKAGIPWFRISTPFQLVAGEGLEPPTSGLIAQSLYPFIFNAFSVCDFLFHTFFHTSLFLFLRSLRTSKQVDRLYFIIDADADVILRSDIYPTMSQQL